MASLVIKPHQWLRGGHAACSSRVVRAGRGQRGGGEGTCSAGFASVSRKGGSSQSGAHICLGIIIREDLRVPLTSSCSAGSLVGPPKLRLAFTSIHLHLHFHNTQVEQCLQGLISLVQVYFMVDLPLLRVYAISITFTLASIIVHCRQADKEQCTSARWRIDVV